MTYFYRSAESRCMKTLEGQLIEQVQNNKRITLKPCTVLLSHYRFTWYLNPVVFQFNHTLFLVLCHVFISCSFVIRALFFFMLMFSTLHINVHMLSLHSEPEKCFCMHVFECNCCFTMKSMLLSSLWKYSMSFSNRFFSPQTWKQ